jgi:hypothetical protein
LLFPAAQENPPRPEIPCTKAGRYSIRGRHTESRAVVDSASSSTCPDGSRQAGALLLPGRLGDGACGGAPTVMLACDTGPVSALQLNSHVVQTDRQSNSESKGKMVGRISIPAEASGV